MLCVLLADILVKNPLHWNKLKKAILFSNDRLYFNYKLNLHSTPPLPHHNQKH